MSACPVCGVGVNEPHKATMGEPYRDSAGNLIADELHNFGPGQIITVEAARAMVRAQNPEGFAAMDRLAAQAVEAWDRIAGLRLVVGESSTEGGSATAHS